MIKKKKSEYSYSSIIYIYTIQHPIDSLDLLERVARLAGRVAELIVVPGLDNEHVGALHFPVDRVGDRQRAVLRMDRKFSL